MLSVSALVQVLPAAAVTGESLANLFENDGYGEPNATTAGGDIKSNLNFVCGKNISVTAQDKLYIGPCISTQGYHMSTYNSSGSFVAKIATENAEIIGTFPGTNLVILCYTVPSDVASVTPVVSQMFEDCMLVTKNQSFSVEDYITYFQDNSFDVKTIVGGSAVAASELVDVFATGGAFAGRADASGGLIAHTSYYATQGYIEAKAGDIIYFAAASIAQSYHLSLYNSSKVGTTNVTKNYCVQYEELGNGYAIYAYRMRSDTGYVRVTTSTAVYNAGVSLATVNQPFSGDEYRAWCSLNQKSPDGIIGAAGSVEASEIVNIFDKDSKTSGYAASTGIVNDSSMVCSASISVSVGDVIYLGPVSKQSAKPIIVAYDSASAVKDTATSLTEETVFESGRSVLSYIVQSGTTYVRINCQADEIKYLLVTKNQLFDKNCYDEWYASTIADGEDLWNPLTAIYGGYASATNPNSVSSTYDCTSYIPVNTGDKIYVAALHVPQPTLGVTYNSERTAVSNLSAGNFQVEFLVSDNVGMLCYTVPAGVSYVRFICRVYLVDYFYITKNSTISLEQYIEKFEIQIPEVDTDSTLYGKKALFVGDSITFGAGESGTFWFSWAGRLGALTGMTVVNNGDSGARVSNTGTSGYISSGLTSNRQDYDLVVMHGGVNDARYNISVGVITAAGTVTFDSQTFGGGLESMFKIATTVYPNADLFYISNFHLDGHSTGSAKDMSKYFDLAEQICEKWNVTYINLYDNTDLNNALKTTTTTYLPDTLHPNAAGYEIITPYIRAELEAFYTVVPVTTEPEVTTEVPVTDSSEITTVVSVTDETTALLDDTTIAVDDNADCSSCSNSSAFLLLAIVLGIIPFTLVKKKN